MKKQAVIAAIMIVLCIMTASAGELAVLEEKAAVNRIVGDSPEELAVQLRTDEINFEHASYVTDREWSHYRNIKGILEKAFGSNIPISTGKYGVEDGIGKAMRRWKQGEIFVLEAVKDLISPKDAEDWKSKFEAFRPFWIFNYEKGGLYLPNSADNEKTFIGQTGHYGTTVASSGMTDDDFAKSMVCSIFSEIGGYAHIKYTTARNRYYWGTRAQGDGYWDWYDINDLDTWEELWLAVKDIFDGDNAMMGYTDDPDARVMNSYILYGHSDRIIVPRVSASDMESYCTPEYMLGDFDGYVHR